MNRLITARTFVISAQSLIREHGLGHKSLVTQSIQNARHIVKQHPQSQWHQTDAVIWEINCALDYVHDGNSREALKSLEFVEGLLDLMLDTDAKASVERLIRSVYPWGSR